MKKTLVGRKIRGSSWRNGNVNAARFGSYRDFCLLDMRTTAGKRLSFIAASILSDLGSTFEDMTVFRRALIQSGATIIARLENMQADITARQQAGKKLPAGLLKDHDRLVELLIKTGDKLEAWQRKPKEMNLQDYLRRKALEAQQEAQRQESASGNGTKQSSSPSHVSPAVDCVQGERQPDTLSDAREEE